MKYPKQEVTSGISGTLKDVYEDGNKLFLEIQTEDGLYNPMMTNKFSKYNRMKVKATKLIGKYVKTFCSVTNGNWDAETFWCDIVELN